jgi:sugar phosphate isomerase/epimerase
MNAPLRLCFSTLVCPQWSLDQIIAVAKENGIGGVDFRGVRDEIDITRLAAFTDMLQVTLADFRANDLRLPCLNTSVTLVSPAPERWQMFLEEWQRHAQLAQRTGTRYLRMFGGAVPKEMSRDEARQLAQRRLRQLSKMSRPFGCMPLLETHDDWTTSEQVLELLHELDPEEAGVLWDIEHPFRRGEAPADTVSRLRRYIRHVHVKDSVRAETGKNSPRLLGEGDLPIGECVHVIREMGYDGWFSLETEKRWHAEAPEPEQSIPQFARFMRELA